MPAEFVRALFATSAARPKQKRRPQVGDLGTAHQLANLLPSKRAAPLTISKGWRELHLIIHDVAPHQRDDRLWAQLPAKPMVKDGRLTIGTDGRIAYSPVVQFEDRETASAFIRAVWEAFEVLHPP